MTVFTETRQVNSAWFPFDIFLHAKRRPSLLLSDRFCFELPLSDALFTSTAAANRAQLILTPNALMSSFLEKNENISAFSDAVRLIFTNLTQNYKTIIRRFVQSNMLPAKGFDVDAKFVFPNDYRYMSGK